MSCERCRASLDAWVDGEVASPELPALEAHLAACPACAAEAAGRSRLKLATRAAAMRFAPSPEILRQMQAKVAPRRAAGGWAWLWSPWPVLAVSALALALTAVLLTRPSAPDAALAEAVDLHVAALASPNPVDVVSTDRHTVKPWFQGKLPFAFNLPELAGSDFRLLGGKLVYVGGKPAAQLLFEVRKHRVSAFLAETPGDGRPGSPDPSHQKGFALESWRAGPLQCTLVSDGAAADLHTLSELLRTAQEH